MRLAVVVVLVGCAPPPGGGGVETPGGTGTPAGTPSTAPYHEPVYDDGTLAHVAPTTRIFQSPEHNNGLSSAVGDFDGDGHADLALGWLDSPGVWEVAVWFGPLPAGDLEMADAPVRLVGGRLGAAGDVDGDGSDELAFGPRLIDVPSAPGVYTDPASLAVATFETFAADAELAGSLLDLDLDGHLDLALNVDAELWLFYGPLLGSITEEIGDLAIDTAGVGLIVAPRHDCWAMGGLYPLPDLSGDGAPDFWLAESVMVHFVAEGDNCPGVTTNVMMAGGDLRGQAVGLDAAVQAGLPYDLRPVGDLDGDGLQELGNATAIYRSADLWASGAAAAPYATLGEGATTFSNPTFEQTSHESLDFSGDGRPEYFVSDGTQWRVVDAGIAGPIDAGGHRVVDLALVRPRHRADLTGDGIPDAISGAAWIYSGAEAAARW